MAGCDLDECDLADRDLVDRGLTELGKIGRIASGPNFGQTKAHVWHTPHTWGPCL